MIIESDTCMAIPPGETIKEQLEIHSMSKEDFVFRMGMNKSKINKLLDGDVEITPKISKKLESVLGISADHPKGTAYI